MRGDLRLEEIARAGDALNVIGVGVGGDDHLAGGEVESMPRIRSTISSTVSR